MNAIEFVKERGWERACELVNECPTEMSFVGKCGFSKTNHKGFVCKEKLKVLVEAWELVQNFGGINGAIDATGTSYIKPSDWEDLNNAINIVEQCQ